MRTKTDKREIYKKQYVVDVGDAEFAVRNYLEQRDLRYCLDIVNRRKPIVSAAEFGCGYGRMTQVLTEYSSNIIGFEREHFLVDDAVRLIPDVKFLQLDDLSETDMPSNCFDVIITFTFLQHLIEPVVRKVTQEMLRCLRLGGHIIICEETDSNHSMGDHADPKKICTVGRSVKYYMELFMPLNLIYQSKRNIEPGYEREDTGNYMIFG